MPARPQVTPRTAAAARAREAYAKVPTATRAADPENYTKNPHEYGDVLIKPCATGADKGKTKLGGIVQRDIVYWIQRHTWGNSKRPEYARLSLSALSKLCGTDRRTMARSIADLCDRGIIEARERKGCGPTVAKMYKLTPERWKKASYYTPKAVEIDGPAEDDAEADDEETPMADGVASPESTVAPGKVSRPQQIAFSPSRGAPAVTLRVVYRSVDLPFPVSFKATPGKSGRVQISCRATAPQRFAIHSPSENVVSVETIRFNEYKAYLDTFLLEFFGKPADITFVKSIVSASGEAPVSVFQRITEKKFRSDRSGKHTTGLLLKLAAEAAAAWRATEAQNAARSGQTVSRPLTPQQRARFLQIEREAQLCMHCSDTGIMQHRDGPRPCPSGCKAVKQ